MRIALLVCFLSLFLRVAAQEVAIAKGEITRDGKVYALYQEIGTPIGTLPMTFQAGMPYNPEARNEKFKDIVVTLPNGDPAIYVTAKLLSSPMFGYLKYYYNIRFDIIDVEINVNQHPYFVELLGKQLVRYNVFKDGVLQPDAAIKLAERLGKTAHAIPQQALAMGSTCNFNTTSYDAPINRKELIPIIIKDKQILLNDYAIGSYALNTRKGSFDYGTYGNEYSYYIKGTNGICVAKLRVNATRSSFYVETTANKRRNQKFYEIYCPDRREDKIIATVAKLLVATGNLHEQEPPRN